MSEYESARHTKILEQCSCVLICIVCLCVHLFVCIFLLLCVPGAVLVLGELHHVAGQVAQLKVGETVVAEVLEQAAAAGRHDVRAAVARPRRGREQLTAGAEEAGGTAASAAVLGLRPRGRGNVTPAAVGQTTCRVPGVKGHE